MSRVGAAAHRPSIITSDNPPPPETVTWRASLLHIPKTGGTALGAALGRYAHRMGHGMTLMQLPLWPPIIAIVRDPVARWRSAWDMTARQRTNTYAPFERWGENPNDYPKDPEAMQFLEGHWGKAFWPQTYWLRDAPYALSRCWYIAHTETLTEDFELLRDALDARGCEMPGPTHPARNAVPGSPTVLTDEAKDGIRDYYADDCALLAALGVGWPPIAPR